MGVSLSCAVAAGAPVSRHDGAFWSRLGNKDKAAYVAGYSDATQSSLEKLDTLKIAAGVFHWKSADKVFAEAVRGLDISRVPTPQVIAYLNKLYANPQYRDFDVQIAIELAAKREIDAQSPSSEVPAVAQASPPTER